MGRTPPTGAQGAVDAALWVAREPRGHEAQNQEQHADHDDCADQHCSAVPVAAAGHSEHLGFARHVPIASFPCTASGKARITTITEAGAPRERSRRTALMAKDLGDAISTALGKVAREAVETVSTNARGKSNGPLSGTKGLAAGVGVAALAPMAAKGAGKLVKGLSSNGASPIQKAGDKVGGAVKDAVGDSVDKAGGAAGIAKEGAKSMIPGVGGGGGGGKGKSKGVEGVGKGRRMPVQQDMDIGVPLEMVYKQWTEYEEWPEFMHRLESVSQEDESHLSFKTKIWGFSRELKAEI